MNGCSAVVTRCQCCLSVCGLLWPIETRRGAGLVQSRLCICVCQHCYWHLVQTSRRWRTHLGQLSSAMPLPCTVLYSTSCEWVPRTILQVCFLLSLLCMVVLLFTSVQLFLSLLWSPYVIGQTIIFLPCDFYLSFFFSSPNLSGHRLDVYHTSTHGVALVWI